MSSGTSHAAGHVSDEFFVRARHSVPAKARLDLISARREERCSSGTFPRREVNAGLARHIAKAARAAGYERELLQTYTGFQGRRYSRFSSCAERNTTSKSWEAATNHPHRSRLCKQRILSTPTRFFPAGRRSLSLCVSIACRRTTNNVNLVPT